MPVKMRPHVVKAGEYLTQLAFKLGFDADVVWQDDANKDLRNKRPNPQMLAPGDLLFVPEKPETDEHSVSSGDTKDYRGEIPKVPIAIQMHDGQQAIANEPYLVLGVRAEPIEGTTDAEGFVRFEVPVHLGEATLVFPNRKTRHRVRIGHLDPPDTESGALARLHHLGFYLPEIETLFWGSFKRSVGERNEPEQRAAEAIRQFQKHARLPVTGVMDDATRDALVHEHGV